MPQPPATASIFDRDQPSAVLPADELMVQLQTRVRDRLRAELRRHGASEALDDPAILADVHRILQIAAERATPQALLLPEILGEPSEWRLDTAMRYQSHRGPFSGSLIVGLKRRLLMPVLRWLFEYSRDNFERQARVNQVLFSCVQELAIENAQLRAEMRRLSKSL